MWFSWPFRNRARSRQRGARGWFFSTSGMPMWCLPRLRPESGLLRESWVRLAKLACLEKRDVTRRLGRLSHADKTRVAEAWRLLFERLP